MGGFRHIQGVVIAESKKEAEVKLYKELNLGSLPCEVKEVDLPDHQIILKTITLKVDGPEDAVIDSVKEVVELKPKNPKK